eukprot:SAG31_NODE_204_length_20414_cov_19.143392_23_plen_174_part_00
MQDKQQLLFPNGSRIPVPEPVFVNRGTAPEGATWSRLPLPGTGYGHRCACDLTDDAHGDHPQDYDCGCKKGEEVGGCTAAGNCSSGACAPCPETSGSDCSRCDNPPRHSWGHYSFPPPCGPDCMALNPGELLFGSYANQLPCSCRCCRCCSCRLAGRLSFRDRVNCGWHCRSA